MANNPYEDILNEETTQPQQEQPTKDNPYESLVQDDRDTKETQVRVSINEGLKKDPSKIAEYETLSKQLSVPVDFIERNYDVVKKQVKTKEIDYNKLLEESPGTSKYLSDPIKAARSQNDIKALRYLEDSLKPLMPNKVGKEEGFLTQAFMDFAPAAVKGTTSMNAGLMLFAAANGKIDQETAIDNITQAYIGIDKIEKNTPDFVKEFNSEVIGKEGKDFDQAFKRAHLKFKKLYEEASFKTFGDFASSLNNLTAEGIDFFYESVKNKKRLKGLVYTSAESLPNMIPSLAAGTAAGAAGTLAGGPFLGAATFFMGSMTAGSVVEAGASIADDLQKRGYDLKKREDVLRALNDQALMQELVTRGYKKGITTASVDAVLNLVGGKLFSKLGKGATATKKAGLLAGEQAIQMAGESTSELAGQLAREDGDITKVEMGEVLLEGVASGPGGAVTIARGIVEESVKSASKAINENNIRKKYDPNPEVAMEQIVENMDKMSEAMVDAEAMKNVQDHITKLQETKNVPGAVKEFIETLSDEQEASNIYFQSDDWDNHFKDKDQSPIEKLREIGGDELVNKYFEAKKNGSFLEIPLSDYIQGIATSEDFDALLENARLKEDGMSLKEAKAFQEELPTIIQKVAKEAETVKNEDPIKKIKKEYKKQVIKAGYNAQDAEILAQLHEARLRVRSKLTGKTPEQLVSELSVSIEKTTISEESAGKISSNIGEESYNTIEEKYGKIPERTARKIIDSGTTDIAEVERIIARDRQLQEAILGVSEGMGQEISRPLQNTPKGRSHSTRIRQLARKYSNSAGLPYRQQREYVEVDPERASRIAQAFQEMKHDPTDPEVKEAYELMIKETLDQFQIIKESGLVIEVIQPGQEDPYAGNSQKMIDDVLKNNHMWLYPTDSGFGTLTDIQDNPLLQMTDEYIGDFQLTANDVFRIVHDFFGHVKEGTGFRARGEENAWQSHVRMYSPKAARAMTTETRGQNSWLNYGPFGAQNQSAKIEDTVFADQKVGLLPEWVMTDGLSEDENIIIERKVYKVEELNPEARQFAEEIISGHIEDMLQEVNASIQGEGKRLIKQGEDVKDISTKSTFPDFYAQMNVKNKAEFAKIVKSKKGKRYNRLRDIAIDRLTNGYESKQIGPVLPDNEFRQLLGMPEVDEFGNIIADEFTLFQSRLVEIDEYGDIKYRGAEANISMVNEEMLEYLATGLSDKVGGEALEINTLEVPQNKQNQGIGSDLLKQIETYAYETGIEYIVLKAEPLQSQLVGKADKGKLKDLIKFYKKNGFTEFKKNKDNSIMIKKVQKTEALKELVITHNLTEANLKHAIKIGGLAVPSLAITKKSQMLKSFGDITLVGSKELADPKGVFKPKVFGADIYSPRYPGVTYDVSDKGVKYLESLVGDIRKDILSDTTNYDQLEEKGLKWLQEDPALIYKFLQDKGIEPDVKYKGLSEERINELKSLGIDKYLKSKEHLDHLNKEFVEDVKRLTLFDEVEKTGFEEERKDFEEALENANYLIRKSWKYADEIELMRNKGKVDTYATERALLKQIEADPNLREEFNQFASDVYDNLGIKEKIFSGFTPSGNRKYIQHSIENVVKILKKELRGGESFNYGLGSLRSKFTPEFKSLKAIIDNKEKIVTNEEFENIKNEFYEKYTEIEDALRKHHSYPESFSYSDAVTGMMADSAKMGVPRALRENAFSGVSEDLMQEIATFLESLREMPTEYFEVKILDVLGIDAFKGAIVPDTVADSTVKILESFGLEVERYNPNDDKSKEAALDNLSNKVVDDILFQDDNKPRGQITFNKGKATIKIFENKDMSTILHESGHLYLEEMRLDFDYLKNNITGQLTMEQEEFFNDVKTILDWLGVESFDDIKREHHEKFARGTEAYFMEGKAPIDSLRKAFSRFKAWLVNIYKTVLNLNVDLTDEVRDVMGRLLAVDDTLGPINNQYKSLLEYGLDLGMDEKKAREYEAARIEAKLAAEEELTAQLIADMMKKESTQYKKRRAEVKEIITEEIEADPRYNMIYNTIDFLRTGKMQNGSSAKLSKQAIVDKYGEDVLKKLPNGIYSVESGIDPDVMASLIGLDSGRMLIDQLMNVIPKDNLIDTMTNERMKDIAPGILSSQENLEAEAVRAANNEKRSKLLELELEILMKGNFKVGKEVIRKLTRLAPTTKMIKAEAKKTIGSKLVSELKPRSYELASRRAAKEAGEAFTKGEFDKAFDLKLKELMNLELYKEAVKVKESIDKNLDKFKKLNKSDKDLAKTRDVSLIQAARHILSKVGLYAEVEDVEAKLQQLRDYDPETYDTVLSLLGSFQVEDKNYKELTIDEFNSMSEAVLALWDLSRSLKVIEIDGKILEKKDVVEGLRKAVFENTKPGKTIPGQFKKKTGAEDFKIKLLSIKASLMRVEFFADLMDNGDKNGAWTSFVFRPISEASDKFRSVKNAKLEEYKNLVEKYEHIFKQKNIFAKNLNYEFKDKAELIGALLHVGNDSNKKKLLLGRNWGTVNEDGSLNTINWDNQIAQWHSDGTLTKDDWDFVQAIWDMMEDLKPEAQKAHKKMYGFYFDEITANEFKTPFGTYKGGYAPAIADQDLVEDQQIRAEQKIFEEQANSFMFPTTGKGFTKNRVENYTKPLVMDMNIFTQHLDKVLRFTHIEPKVKEVMGLLHDRDLRDDLFKMDQSIAKDLLIPWLQRSAQQKVETPVQGEGSKFLNHIAKTLRTNTGLNIMFGNISNALQQFTGFTVAAVKVKPKYLRDAMWDYIRNSKEIAAEIDSKSEFMRERVGSQMFSINTRIEEIIVNPTKYEKFITFAKQHGYILQSVFQNVVDNITWLAAYRESLENGATEKEAIRKGNSTVRETQGSFNPEDISKFEAGTPFERAFSMFYSYFNNQSNLLGTETAKVAKNQGLRDGAGRLFYIYTMGFMMPAFLAEMIVKGMAGKIDEDDDDEYMDDIIATFFGSQVRSGLATIPIAGQIGAGVMNAFDDKPYNDRISLSPVVSFIEGAVRSPKSVYDAVVEDKSKTKAVRDSLTLIGLLTGAPVLPLSKPINYSIDVKEGKKDPKNKLDYARGLITGK